MNDRLRATSGPLWKASRTARAKAKQSRRRDAVTTEDRNKRIAKKRDHYRCRFPLCGCERLKLPMRVESSHDQHKGMGGNPSGERSRPEWLMTLCRHRHQDGAFSRHKNTIRAVYLDPSRGNDGPVIWEADRALLQRHGFHVPRVWTGEWIELCRETAVQTLATLEPWQAAILATLGDMDC